jgi:hypothetical protein
VRNRGKRGGAKGKEGIGEEQREVENTVSEKQREEKE